MTLLSQMIALFPFSVLVFLGLNFWLLLQNPSWWAFLLPLLIVYIYPVLTFRFVIGASVANSPFSCTKILGNRLSN